MFEDMDDSARIVVTGSGHEEVGRLNDVGIPASRADSDDATTTILVAREHRNDALAELGGRARPHPDDTGSDNDVMVARSIFIVEVLHRADQIPQTLADALHEADEGHAVGSVTNHHVERVADRDVPDALRALGNDGTFFDDDLHGDDTFDNHYADL